MPFAAGIHYRVYHSGTGTPVVLIHGAGGTYLSWPPNIRRLAGYRVYALDLPAHGESKGVVISTVEGFESAVLEWIIALELERVVLVGHSMGGAVAISLALHEPGRVAGLALLGSATRMDVNPTLITLASSDETARRAFELVVKWSFSKQAPAKLVELVLQRMMDTPRDVFLADLQACDTFDLTADIGGVRQPAIIICGDEDKMTPPSVVQSLAEGLARATMLMLPQCGHMVMYEQPETIARVLNQFLDDI